MDERKLTPPDEFDKALASRAGEYGVELGEGARARLKEYFELVAAWNGRLHLVAPCPPAEFATRHVLESLLALPFMSAGSSVVDVGSGAGLPVIPCLIARPDLKATLIESSRKKAVFLREALWKLGLRESARVVAERFENVEPPEADYLTCRAIERFGEILPRLLSWSAGVRVLLLFGGGELGRQIERAGVPHQPVRAPGSERRFVFVVRRAVIA